MIGRNPSWIGTEAANATAISCPYGGPMVMNRPGSSMVLASKQTFNFAEISCSRSDRNPSLVGNISTVGQRSNQQLRNSHPRNLSRLF